MDLFLPKFKLIMSSFVTSMNESFPSTICLLSINTYLSKEFNFLLNPSSVTFLPNPTSLEDAKLTLSVILLISLLVPSDSLTSNEEFSFCKIALGCGYKHVSYYFYLFL